MLGIVLDVVSIILSVIAIVYVVMHWRKEK